MLQLSKFEVTDLDPLGRQIIEAARSNATVEQYANLIPGDPIMTPAD